MKYLVNPRLFFVVNLIPILILSFILYNDYYIIKPSLSTSEIKLWGNFASVLLISFLFNIFYLFNKYKKNQEIGFNFVFLNITFNIFFIYLANTFGHNLVPADIPIWMLSSDPIFEVYSFLLPTIVLCLLIFSSKTIDITEELKNNNKIVFLLLIPVLFLLLIYGFEYLTGINYSKNKEVHFTFIMILFIIVLYGYLFLNAILYFVKKMTNENLDYSIGIKLIFSLILPIFGSFIFTAMLYDENQYSIILLIILNGSIILIPPFGNQYTRLIIFGLKSLIFPISLYFFIIFLPWVILIPILMIFLGFGLLLISPIFSFLIVTNEIYIDYTYLKEKFNKYSLRLIFVGGFAIIPLIIHISFIKDKAEINEILDYVYNPDYTRNIKFNDDKVVKTIYSIQKNKTRNRQDFIYNELPYISQYYNWLVFDNLTISDNKINKIKEIFIGDKNPTDLSNLPDNRLLFNQAEITDTKVRSVYNENGKYWESWVDFEITNFSNITQNEFVIEFNLPVGTYIGDYYLYIGNKKEMGQLAEKKSALWIYSNIVSVKRDPGLINYVSNDKINFRVFPFASNEMRKTGIKLIHKDITTLNIGKYNLILGNPNSNERNIKSKIIENKNYLYIPKEAKENLSLVERDFYFHFLIDASSSSNSASNIRKIENLFEQYPSIKNKCKLTLVGSTLNTFNYDNNWKQKIKENKNSGGFYLDRAFNYYLINNFKNNFKYYAKFIVISYDLSKSIIDTDYNNIDFTIPEGGLFYYVNNNNEIESHLLTKHPYSRDAINYDLSLKQAVRVFKLENNTSIYLANNSKNSLIPKNTDGNFDLEITDNQWEQGNLLKSNYYNLLLNPQLNDKYWNKLVNMSFRSGVLSDYTSYIVLENESQRRLLKKKQKEALSGKKALDLGEDNLNMSEPNPYLIFVFLLVLIILLLTYKNKLIVKTIRQKLSNL